MPVTGFVKDERGQADRRGSDLRLRDTATTDAEGRFTLRGFGPNPVFQSFYERAQAGL